MFLMRAKMFGEYLLNFLSKISSKIDNLQHSRGRYVIFGFLVNIDSSSRNQVRFSLMMKEIQKSAFILLRE